jgi:tRNA (mo5U34)-methyltransferase
MPEPSEGSKDLADEVATARWYHCIELPGGIITPGEYDLPDALARIPFPDSLEGKRCLDVGVRDGFWAFAMERRGAAEVVGIDLDDPDELDWPQPLPHFTPDAKQDLAARARTFGIAARALDSKVQRRNQSVYGLSRAEVGTFDFAFIGTLLLHLRDPIGALMAIRRVVTGELMVNDVVSLPLTAAHPRKPSAVLMDLELPFWWTPNAAALRRYIEAAGWRITAQSRAPYFVKYGPTGAPPTLFAAKHPIGHLAAAATLRRGMPHMWYRAVPRPDRGE